MIFPYHGIKPELYFFPSLCALYCEAALATFTAEAFQSKAQTESSYRRIKRFFAGYTYCYEQFGRLILHWLNLNRYTLCMDSKFVGKQWFQWLE